MVRVVMEAQFTNTPHPMTVTEPGRSTEASEEQFLKAYFPISDSESGRDTDARLTAL